MAPFLVLFGLGLGPDRLLWQGRTEACAASRNRGVKLVDRVVQHVVDKTAL